jgi:hypothetical protein
MRAVNASVLWPSVTIYAWPGQYQLVLETESPEDRSLYSVRRRSASSGGIHECVLLDSERVIKHG